MQNKVVMASDEYGRQETQSEKTRDKQRVMSGHSCSKYTAQKKKKKKINKFAI